MLICVLVLCGSLERYNLWNVSQWTPDAKLPHYKNWSTDSKSNGLWIDSIDTNVNGKNVAVVSHDVHECCFLLGLRRLSARTECPEINWTISTVCDNLPKKTTQKGGRATGETSFKLSCSSIPRGTKPLPPEYQLRLLSLRQVRINLAHTKYILSITF